MRAFLATYYDTHGYGACTDYSAIVVAEDEVTALGWCLQYYPDTNKARWELEEFKVDEAGVTHVQDSCV